MRSIRNFAWFLLAFGLTVFSGLAFAQTVTPEYYWRLNVTPPIYHASSGEPICQEVITKSGTPQGFVFHSYVLANVSTGNCNVTKPPSTTPSIYQVIRRLQCAATLPYWDSVQNKCVAIKPVDPDPDPDPDPPGQCLSSDVEYEGTWKVGTVNPNKIIYSPLNTPANATDGNCCIKATEVTECWSYSNAPNSPGYCTFKYKRIGGICGPNGNNPPPNNSDKPSDTSSRQDVPPVPSPQGDCPKGMVQIGVNSDGVPMCGGTGSSPDNKPPPPPKIETEKTETSDDGTKTTTKTETTKNSDGSETVTKTITIIRPDGTKQTDNVKEVGKTPAGTPGKDDSKKDDEKFDLCKQNPNLSICKNSSVTGSCGAIACTGDAIQCATLRAAAAMQCKQKTDDDELKASDAFKLGSSVLAGNDPMNGDLPIPGNGAVIDVPTLKADGWLGGGAAFDDFSFTVQGNTIVVPLSQLTKYFLMFRYALMVVASMISFRILSGAILRE